ncbi:hypothetical protein FEM48_Zijuj05G0174600 [Ziziphus jujuba var. spinosa]|uniref:Uncharacterized protein n=1 Tax=Ziziphus jujuba var. spinosa TaxID=714518 RepID=A0A978VG57_ZIZJJ|nr:hypothetical protein FEM48_Zijuj05G0174600 [Ziziphus jujuba var. spinosa]
MKQLDYLDLSATAIKLLPSSIELLVRLKEFSFFSCVELMFIPTNIYKLLNLEHPLLGDCSKLSKFLKNITFSKFDGLLYSPTKTLPSYINLSKYELLWEIPELPQLKLDASDCKSLGETHDVADQPNLNDPTPIKGCFADVAYQDPQTM